MNVLLICNYQREIPPFMISQIKWAEKYFDKIEYVNPTLYNDNSAAIVSEKVVFNSISRKRTTRQIWGMIKGGFRKEVQQDIKKAICARKFNRRFFIHLASELYPSEVLFQRVYTLLNTKYKNDRVCVLAAWFDCNAYTVARLKKTFPSITAVSFAHAFEVNPERGEFIDVSLNEFKHNHLEQVTFISKKVLNNYINLMGYSKKEFLNKINVCYLGCENRIGIAPASSGEKVYLCSCAGMTEVKRIDLILDALEQWSGKPIVWTHIGSGPLYEHIKERAQRIDAKNQYITVRLLGKLDNREVHIYYRENCIDLFINVSESEGIPVSIMEAISYGIPVIATDVGGTSEIVTSKNGFLLEKDLKGEDICEAIQKYVNSPLEKKKEMRKQARTTWEEKFNSDKTLLLYYERLRMMMEQKSNK